MAGIDTQDVYQPLTDEQGNLTVAGVQKFFELMNQLEAEGHTDRVTAAMDSLAQHLAIEENAPDIDGLNREQLENALVAAVGNEENPLQISLTELAVGGGSELNGFAGLLATYRVLDGAGAAINSIAEEQGLSDEQIEQLNLNSQYYTLADAIHTRADAAYVSGELTMLASAYSQYDDVETVVGSAQEFAVVMDILSSLGTIYDDVTVPETVEQPNVMAEAANLESAGALVDSDGHLTTAGAQKLVEMIGSLALAGQTERAGQAISLLQAQLGLEANTGDIPQNVIEAAQNIQAGGEELADNVAILSSYLTGVIAENGVEISIQELASYQGTELETLSGYLAGYYYLDSIDVYLSSQPETAQQIEMIRSQYATSRPDLEAALDAAYLANNAGELIDFAQHSDLDNFLQIIEASNVTLANGIRDLVDMEQFAVLNDALAFATEAVESDMGRDTTPVQGADNNENNEEAEMAEGSTPVVPVIDPATLTTDVAALQALGWADDAGNLTAEGFDALYDQMLEAYHSRGIFSGNQTDFSAELYGAAGSQEEIVALVHDTLENLQSISSNPDLFQAHIDAFDAVTAVTDNEGHNLQNANMALAAFWNEVGTAIDAGELTIAASDLTAASDNALLASYAAAPNIQNTPLADIVFPNGRTVADAFAITYGNEIAAAQAAIDAAEEDGTPLEDLTPISIRYNGVDLPPLSPQDFLAVASLNFESLSDEALDALGITSDGLTYGDVVAIDYGNREDAGVIQTLEREVVTDGSPLSTFYFNAMVREGVPDVGLSSTVGGLNWWAVENGIRNEQIADAAAAEVVAEETAAEETAPATEEEPLPQVEPTGTVLSAADMTELFAEIRTAFNDPNDIRIPGEADLYYVGRAIALAANPQITGSMFANEYNAAGDYETAFNTLQTTIISRINDGTLAFSAEALIESQLSSSIITEFALEKISPAYAVDLSTLQDADGQNPLADILAASYGDMIAEAEAAANDQALANDFQASYNMPPDIFLEMVQNLGDPSTADSGHLLYGEVVTSQTSTAVLDYVKPALDSYITAYYGSVEAFEAALASGEDLISAGEEVGIADPVTEETVTEETVTEETVTEETVTEETAAEETAAEETVLPAPAELDDAFQLMLMEVRNVDLSTYVSPASGSRSHHSYNAEILYGDLLTRAETMAAEDPDAEVTVQVYGGGYVTVNAAEFAEKIGAIIRSEAGVTYEDALPDATQPDNGMYQVIGGLIYANALTHEGETLEEKLEAQQQTILARDAVFGMTIEEGATLEEAEETTSALVPTEVTKIQTYLG